MTVRTVLVTGAGGFVGASLVTGFAELGLDVVAADLAFDDEGADRTRLAGSAARAASHGATGETPRGSVTRIEGDLGEALMGELHPVDVVVHGAWITTDPDILGISREEYLDRNLEPLRALLAWARRSKPRAFVFLSSSGVFTPSDAAHELTDADEPTGTVPYAAAKREAERLVAEHRGAVRRGAGSEARGLEGESSQAITVRLGYLFGPGERPRRTRTRPSLVAEWISAAEQGNPLPVSSDDPLRDWTFVGDLAPALLKVIEGPPVDFPIHLGSPHRYRDSEVASLIADRYPGSRVDEIQGSGSVKPPMKPSHLPALEGFVWTDFPTALDQLPGQGAAA